MVLVFGVGMVTLMVCGLWAERHLRGDAARTQEGRVERVMQVCVATLAACCLVNLVWMFGGPLGGVLGGLCALQLLWGQDVWVLTLPLHYGPLPRDPRRVVYALFASSVALLLVLSPAHISVCGYGTMSSGMGRALWCLGGVLIALLPVGDAPRVVRMRSRGVE